MAGLLADLPKRRLLGCLARLDAALRERPAGMARHAAVDDQEHPARPVGSVVDHDTTCGDDVLARERGHGPSVVSGRCGTAGAGDRPGEDDGARKDGLRIKSLKT